MSLQELGLSVGWAGLQLVPGYIGTVSVYRTQIGMSTKFHGSSLVSGDMSGDMSGDVSGTCGGGPAPPAGWAARPPP